MAVVGAPANARVVHISIDSRVSPAYGGKAFGGITYEIVSGHASGELDPKEPLNAIINDIALAPRNARGKVEYSATFTLVKPIDLAKASGVLIYQVPNRGNSPLNPEPSADELNGGHILLSSGWQGDLTPRKGLETLTVPAAKNSDGSPITGPVIARLSNLPEKSTTASLTQGYSGLAYQRPFTLDTTKALLTAQYSDDGELIPVAASDWSFADCGRNPFPGDPDGSKVCLKSGFRQDMLYQLVYTAKDPLVLGIGFAATRDIVSFFRYAMKDGDGAPNPVAGAVRHAIGLGTSQSGNFIKSFDSSRFQSGRTKTNRMGWSSTEHCGAAESSELQVCHSGRRRRSF